MQSSRETSYFTALLFKKKDDQEQPSTSYTTPRPSRSPRSPSSAGMASGAGAQRRRSLTPTGSTALQPAEPPSRSLYSDTSGVGQIGNKENLPLVLHQPDTELAFQALVLDAGKENVVTVFGFPNNEATGNLVLQEFGKCGDILRYHSEKQCNWMHIQYGTKYEAQRALLKNGLVLSASVMIGVQPLASQFKPLFDSTSEDLSMSIPPSSLKEQELSSKDVLLPVPPKSGWSKVSEFVFGL
ncbi:hypothetical protein WJX79_007487 [Trebouxia sp. C0005]